MFFVAFYLLFGVLLTIFQERVVYHPNAQSFEVCDELAHAQKVTVSGTRMYVKEGEKGMVVIYHGNAGSACDRAFLGTFVSGLGYGYIIPEYAGYSDDTRDRPSHAAVKQDVAHVVSYTNEKYKGRVVLVLGESIGTA
jgi:uncharacterized protein